MDAGVRFVGVLMDVTARKQLRDQLSHSQKMEPFGQLAGGVAHDFNNFLTESRYSDLPVGGKFLAATGAKYLSEIRSAAGRAAHWTRQLLTFSRRQPLEPRVLEVNTVIHNLDAQSRGCSRNIFRSLRADGGKKTHQRSIRINSPRLFINLAVNAAMPCRRRHTGIENRDDFRQVANRPGNCHWQNTSALA